MLDLKKTERALAMNEVSELTTHIHIHTLYQLSRARIHMLALSYIPNKELSVAGGSKVWVFKVNPLNLHPFCETWIVDIYFPRSPLMLQLGGVLPRYWSPWSNGIKVSCHRKYWPWVLLLVNLCPRLYLSLIHNMHTPTLATCDIVFNMFHRSKCSPLWTTQTLSVYMTVLRRVEY